MQSYAYDRLSVIDNSFLAIESPTTHQHVAAVLCLDARPLSQPDGGIDIDTIRTYIASRLHLIPRYRQRLATVPLGNRPSGSTTSTSTSTTTSATRACRGPATSGS